jgi:thioredoxin reductase (NADPH)
MPGAAACPWTTTVSREKPVIFVFDPNAPGSLLVQELASRYGGSYELTIDASIDAALVALEALVATTPVALILADRQAGGAALLDASRALHPRARRGLLLNWNESRTHREEIAAAFARRQAECFVTKPAGIPDERFHRSITELLDEWWRIHGSPLPSVRIIGAEASARVSEIGDSLQRHDVAHTVHLLGSDEARALLGSSDVGSDELPVIVLTNGRTLRNPSNIEIAEALGARTRPGTGVYDLIVVGGGPAGLSAAVYAESEGRRTALIESTAMGGQAGTSSMIRNYLGFPRGISGAELAVRAFEQAILFGTEMVYGSAAVGLGGDADVHVVELGDGTEVPGRAVVIATGVSYRTLGVPSLEPFHGRGVFYGAAMSEASRLVGEDVFVVGGGNSAGQAAIHLARFARLVTVLIRSDSLATSMSDYLVNELDATPNIEVRFKAEVAGGGGRSRLERLEVRDRVTGTTTSQPAAGLFVLIGAAPFTGWLPAVVERDAWGYVVTGPSEAAPERLPFESTAPGVFAIGDVRRGSVKRVASAVGEGAICVRHVHEHLTSLGEHGTEGVRHARGSS